jgi:hypothetical protein
MRKTARQLLDTEYSDFNGGDNDQHGVAKNILKLIQTSNCYFGYHIQKNKKLRF